jgi:antirestriction protein ArdC
MSYRRVSLSPEERESKRAEQRQRVEESVRALLTSQGWRRMVEVRASFHDYSLGNVLLIAQQCPHASHVAGYKAWRELGRQVRKGEHGIRIYAPMIVGGSKDERKQARQAAALLQPTSGAKMPEDEVRVLFRAVSVFDVSQTDGEPLPEVPTEPITGESHAGLLPMLEGFAQSQGITVRTEATQGQGHYDRERSEIVLSDELSSANARVHVLIHELAHAVGVPSYAEHGRAAAEVIVETAATITCGAVGLDTSGESVPYLASWAESGDLEAIKAYAETVDSIAATIEKACGL